MYAVMSFRHAAGDLSGWVCIRFVLVSMVRSACMLSCHLDIFLVTSQVRSACGSRVASARS